jgi:integrase/recombinase XerC
VKSPKIPKGYKKDYLTANQLREIVTPLESESESGARDYAMVILMACCGLRTIEVARASIEDLKPLGGKTVLYVQGKGQVEKAEFVTIPQVVEKAIRAYLAKRTDNPTATSPLFASASNNNKGGRLTTVAISAIAKKAMVSAGFSSERLTAHSLRHSAITNAILAGNSLEEAQQLARHASITTTMIYNHAIDKLKNHCADDVAMAIFG